MGSGSILREVIAAADLLSEDFGVEADIWSILGVNQLHREGDAYRKLESPSSGTAREKNLC